jgi:hypothetical protein
LKNNLHNNPGVGNLNDPKNKDSKTAKVLDAVINESIIDLFTPILKTGELSNSPEDEVLFIRILIDKAVKNDPNSENHFNSYLKYLNYILTGDYTDIEDIIVNFHEEYSEVEF